MVQKYSYVTEKQFVVSKMEIFVLNLATFPICEKHVKLVFIYSLNRNLTEFWKYQILM